MCANKTAFKCLTHN